MLKNFLRLLKPNPLDKILRQAFKEERRRFLIVWNRGLGDIPLGLYALAYRIRSMIPAADVTFITRKDLEDGFSMLENTHTLVCERWKRGEPCNLEEALKEHELEREDFDLIFESPDPTKWLYWQLGKLTPKLMWDSKWDSVCEKHELGDDRSYIGVHIDSETGQYYGYEKNWPVENWKALIDSLSRNYRRKIILFGNTPDENFSGENVIDLRGKTSLFEVIAIVKNYCSHLIAPDSGILSTLYYVNTYFPIKVVSLWADPHQGVLRQKVRSPNHGFKHIPLIGKKKNIHTIEVLDVISALFS